MLALRYCIGFPFYFTGSVLTVAGLLLMSLAALISGSSDEMPYEAKQKP